MKESSVDQGAYDYAKWELSASLVRHLNALSPDSQLEELDRNYCFRLLERPPELTMGDYAFPCFRLAKPLKMKPPESKNWPTLW